MQAQGNYPPVLNQPQQSAGFDLGEMQNYMNQFGQGSQLPAQQPAAPQQAQVMAERMRQMRQPYNQSVMPDIYRQRAMEQQRQKMMQQPRGAGAAGIMRKLMLERARKRYAQEQMQQRQRFNPFLNR
jgi:hypothetical protein